MRPLRAEILALPLCVLLGYSCLFCHDPVRARRGQVPLYGTTQIWVWGVILFNTLVVTGVFEKFRRWLVAQGTADVRVQTMLFAWAFGALLEGLVGFGYPWAFVAPILISLGIPDLDAIRVAAIANNAPPNQPDNALFFSAGPNKGNNGLFGTLTPVAAELTEGSDQ